MKLFKKKKKYVKLPMEVYIDTVECLRLAPIWMLLGSDEQFELGDDFKEYKWKGYEKDAAEEANRLFHILLKEGTKQILGEKHD